MKYIDEKSSFITDFKPKKYKVQNLKNYFFKEHLLVHPTLFCKYNILKNNLYDVNQKSSEDFELWIRLIFKNYNFGLIENYLLYYRIMNKESLEKRIKKIRIYNIYAIMALKKNHSRKKIFLNFKKFYFKSLLLFYFLKLPINFIKVLVFIKDKLK